MKEVIKQYGTSFLTVAVALLLSGIIFGRMGAGGEGGIFSVLKNAAQISGKELAGNAEVVQAMERKRPDISWNGRIPKAGSLFCAEDYFLALDADGNRAQLKLLYAENAQGEELEITDGMVRLGEQGNYSFRVQASDAASCETVLVFRIPAGRR